MKPPGHAVAVLLIAAGLVGCSAEKPLDPQAEAKRLEFCRSVIDAVKPGDKTCGPYLEQLKREQPQPAGQPAPLSPEAKSAIDLANEYMNRSRSKLDLARQLSQAKPNGDACGMYVEASNDVRRAETMIGSPRQEIESKRPDVVNGLRDLVRTSIAPALERCRQQGWVSASGAASAAA